MKHDFDYLKGLYESNPDEFDKVTSGMINDFIEGLPDGKKEVYRAKQWRLEQGLKKIVDPVARMNKMVEIFWEGVNKNVAEMRKLGFTKKT